MNTNEAPGKLYISYEGYGVFGEDGSTERTKNSQIEYTRTDAFIEKAEIYLKGRLLRYIDLCERGVGISTEEFIEKFKNYMKGE